MTHTRKRPARGPLIACAAAALLGFAWGPVLGLPADASTRPSPADRVAMVRANVTCAAVPEEVAYEDCVVGAFILERRRYIDGDYYTTDFGRGPKHYVELTRASTDARAPYCQFDVYGHEIGVMGVRGQAGATVAVRVNGRTLRGKLDRKRGVSFRTRGTYTQEDVRAFVDGVWCDGT